MISARRSRLIARCSRPDVFRAVALMSAPFAGTAVAAIRHAGRASAGRVADPHAFSPISPSSRPRKHYQHYYGTREADDNMRNAAQGIHAFLRAYYHMKSADWPRNKPFKLAAFTRRRAGEDADLLHHGSRPRHGRDGGAGDAVGRRRSPRAAGCPTTSSPSTPASSRAPAFRAGCNGIAALTAASSPPSSRPFPAAPSTCPPASSPARATGASIRVPGALERMAGERLHAMARHASRRRRRALGAAGAAGGT